jgi:acyl-[acyl-carrier-protein]-phospholipid O-acyltransferase/long-chain-fatty-acid--[acyl-carrier-protein] ligase
MAAPSQARLLASRRLGPLFIAQALGAFNDNAFRAAVAILITYVLAPRLGFDGGMVLAVATGVFILPFFLFSGLAGQLADRHDKALVARRVKLAEIPIMAAAGFTLYADSIALQLAVLFLAGLRSTFFGPVKYAILPQHLERSELVAGNGLVEMGTFLAILLGTLFGGLMVIAEAGRAIVGVAGVALAATGYLASRFIPPAPANGAGAVDWNPLSSTAAIISQVRRRPDVFQAVIGISWFWFLGTVFLTELPALTRGTLGGSELLTNLFIALFTMGIASGSLMANRLLEGEISARHVPLCALALSLVIVETWFALEAGAGAFAGGGPIGPATFLSRFAGLRIAADLALVSFIAGLYVVPLYALVQDRTPSARRARVIAANNVVNSGFMAAAALVSMAVLAAGFSIPDLLLMVGLANLLVVVRALQLLPQETVKVLARQLFRLLYRVEVKGLENYRAAGRRAVIVANHPSRLDGALIGAFLPDRAHVAVDAHASTSRWARALALLFDLVFVDPANPMAVRPLVALLKKGSRLVTFPEGRVSVTGAVMKVSDLPGVVAHLAHARILPVRIEGAQYSLFSRLRGRPRRRPFPRISLTFLPPVELHPPEGMKGTELREFIARRLYDLMSDMLVRTADIDRHLLLSLLDARTMHGGGRAIVEDAQCQALTYNRLVAGLFVLGRRLARLTAPERTVGILLPNANGTLLAFLGLLAHGKVPALLNFSTGAVNMAAACAAAQVSTIVTSRRFIAEGKLEADLELLSRSARIVHLDDVRQTIGLADRLFGLWARTFPHWALKRAGALLDASGPAVVLFTSGSEGVPKGVVLSHRNLQANRVQVAARIDFSAQDVVFNALPMFHAFGLTVGTLLPVLSGMRTILYPSPLHYRMVPELVYACEASILLGTDTFLSGYARNAHPYDFSSIRLVVAGAERVKPETRALWMEKFGLRIIEGYGATECSPVIAANTPMHFRAGTVGRLLDGIEWRLEPVEGIEGAGRLVIKGPNVMLGYLRADEPGLIDPPPGGWYDTGDIVSVDALGFVTIEGRAKRFSKIGGEMVSLTAVEALVAEAFPEQAHAVVAVPDPRKGEQLVLVTTDETLDRRRLAAALRKAGASELAVPRLVLRVAELPVLASGKTDYVALGRLAREARLTPP